MRTNHKHKRERDGEREGEKSHTLKFFLSLKENKKNYDSIIFECFFICEEYHSQKKNENKKQISDIVYL